MPEPKNPENKDEVWFVYDGDCPLCKMGATHFRIQQAVGNLQLLNKRETDNNHPLIKEINEQKLDLDKGMVVKLGNNLYQGSDALHIMALIGSKHGWFNRINALFFKSEKMARFCYPSMRAVRNLLLAIKGVPKINNLENQ